MNNKFFPCLFVFFVSLSIASFSQVRVVKELHSDWKFHKGANENAFKSDFNDSDWENVSVPHDWAIYGPFNKDHDSTTQL